MQQKETIGKKCAVHELFASEKMKNTNTSEKRQ
jgi:hypothetical protein